MDSIMSVVCTEYDGFMGDNTYWTAKLNNNQTVYQDDGREGLQERSAWLRLQKYCQDNGLYIVEFQIQFRDHIEYEPSNAEGYFFSFGVSATWGIERTYNQFITGHIDGDHVKIKKWLVPELIVMESRNRSIKECEHLLIKKD